MPRRAASPSSDYSPPLADNLHLVKLLAPQGSSAFLSSDSVGTERLVEISGRLRRVKGLIVTRGDYAVVSLFPKGESVKPESRLVGEIVHVLTKSDVREWKKSGAWPAAFDETPQPPSKPVDESDEDDQEEEEVDEEGS